MDILNIKACVTHLKSLHYEAQKLSCTTVDLIKDRYCNGTCETCVMRTQANSRLICDKCR